jgi:crossover junction endodeoxyribonuclease RuvC
MGYGLIDRLGNKLTHVAHGTLTSDAGDDLAVRLRDLFEGLTKVIEAYAPDEAAVEQTFVNKDPVATLKLGQARAVALLVPALCHLPVAEYAPNHVKKAIVGVGHAEKQQIHHMVGVLLPGLKVDGDDAADALALAICHAHHMDGRAQAARVARALAAS